MTVGHNPPVPASPRCCIWLSGPGFQGLDKRTLGFRTSMDVESSPSYSRRPVVLDPVSYLFPVTFLCVHRHFSLRSVVTHRCTHAQTSDFIYMILVFHKIWGFESPSCKIETNVFSYSLPFQLNFG